jgi:hypothetical protein
MEKILLPLFAWYMRKIEEVKLQLKKGRRGAEEKKGEKEKRHSENWVRQDPKKKKTAT